MKSLVFCGLLALVALAYSAPASSSSDLDDKCEPDTQAFLTCLKDQKKSNGGQDKEKAKKDLRDQVNQCFTKAGCDQPDWSEDPLKMQEQQRQFNSTPEAVKECIKDDFIEKIGSKLNECLNTKGIQNLNISRMIDLAEESGFGGDDEKANAGFQKLITAQLNIVKAVDKCAQKNGGDTKSVRPLEQCLQKIKQDLKPKICAVVKPCEDKVKNPECKKRCQDVSKALCECRKEDETKMAQKLRALAQNNDTVSGQDFLNAVTGDEKFIENIVKLVDKCYEQTGETKPKDSKKGSGEKKSSPKGGDNSVNGTMVEIMADMIDLDAQYGDECIPCQ